MRNTQLPTLGYLLHASFCDWLKEQRNASRCTLIAYRDAWRLFLRFVAKRQKRPVASLQLDHLTQREILAFLHYLEHERDATITTRNSRLAAFSTYLLSAPLCRQQSIYYRTSRSHDASRTTGSFKI